jgi:hypothetical protein
MPARTAASSRRYQQRPSAGRQAPHLPYHSPTKASRPPARSMTMSTKQGSKAPAPSAPNLNVQPPYGSLSHSAAVRNSPMVM